MTEFELMLIEEIQNNHADIINSIERLENMLVSHLNNFAAGIKFLQYGVALFLLIIAIKFLWKIIAQWFFGGI